MNFVQSLEECLRDLATEARKQHPGVKESSERATLRLRALQNEYAMQVRQANALRTADHHPTTRLFASSELLHPFLLATNYPNASPALLDCSFRALQLLMEANAIHPPDALQILRVWMIQAHVVVQYYKRQYKVVTVTDNDLNNNEEGEEESYNEEEDNEEEEDSTNTATNSKKQQPATSSSSSSSWFSWSKSSTTNNNSLNNSSNSHAVQSTQSSATSSAQSPAQMETRAKQILSCLLQLLGVLQQQSEPQSQQSQPKDLWMTAIALASIWLPYLPRKHTVHQAARMTLSQVLLLLFTAKNNQNKLQQDTWQDLLYLSTYKRRKTQPSKKASAATALGGAFQLCKLPTNATDNNNSSATTVVVYPPTPIHALELLTQLLKDAEIIIGMEESGAAVNTDSSDSPSSSPPLRLALPDALLLHTMETALKLLLLELHNNSHTTASASTQSHHLEYSLRIIQFTTLLFQKYYLQAPNECRQLFLQLLIPVNQATEQCRRMDDFEDGYCYHNTIGSASGNKLTTLLPATLLWKAGWCLEAIVNSILYMSSSESQNANTSGGGGGGMALLLDDAKCMVSLSETLSDYATILSSCQDHIRQLVVFGQQQQQQVTGREVFDKTSTAASYKSSSSLMRKAEQACTNGSVVSLLSDSVLVVVVSASGGSSASALDAASHHSATASSGSSAASSSTTAAASGILGETIWLALQGIIRIAECLPLLEPVQPTLEQTFAPSLAVLQHILKRCCGSSELVQLALRGYVNLADACVPHSETHRKALLLSLCKLSLPTWGKRDVNGQLQDHHIIILLYLCRIVHAHYDAIGEEWNLILQTLDELSVMLIASKQLSDSSYHAALAVSVLFGRLAPFTTCFSTDSLLQMAHALTNITKARMEGLDVVGNSDTVLAQRASSTAETSGTRQSQQDHETSISSKIMNMGVRAIYGSASDSDKQQAEKVVLERSRNVFYEDYRQEFVKRLSSSQSSIRVSSVGHVPYVLALLTDIIMANSFRFQECGDELSNLLSTLASTCPAVRPFTMDIISVVAMSHMSNDRAVPAPFVGPGRLVFVAPMQSQLWAVEAADTKALVAVVKKTDNATAADQQTSDGKSQSELLTPLCQKIQSTNQPDMAESSLGALNAILEGVGHNITGDVWSKIINAVASLSGDPSYEIVDRTHAKWANCSSLSFRCLKFIVDDFRDKFSQSSESEVGTFTALLDCCSAFGRSKHDVNTSLTAITLLWTIADQDPGSDSIDRALSRLVDLSSDSRAEVRNAAVNTIFSCIVGRGSAFSPKRWESCFSDTIFGVYDMTATKAGLGDEETMASGEKRYRVALHHSRDSNQKQWLETQVIALRGLTRLLRNYFSFLLETSEISSSTNDTSAPWFQDAWVRILDAAFDAATQGGGRDTVAIRTVGLELMVLCCQLASDDGIGASTAQARVGTNMEVINGALRTVRESQPLKAPATKTHSAETSALQRQLFLEAFDAIESYKESVEKLTKQQSGIDETVVQIIHSFASGLGHLYDCSKNNELAPRTQSINQPFDSVDDTPQHKSEDQNDDNLEARFVSIIDTMLATAGGYSMTRFLNQGQRASLNLLRNMAMNGSCQAFTKLIDIASVAFFVKKNDAAGTNEESLPLLSFEAADAVSEAIVKETVPESAKLFALYKVIDCFLRYIGTHPKPGHFANNRCYDKFSPVVNAGLVAAKDDSLKDTSDLLWQLFNKCLAHLFSSTAMDNGFLAIQAVPELLKIITVARDNCMNSQSELCAVLAQGASEALEIARTNNVRPKDEDNDSGEETVVVVNQQREDMLTLFRCCFDACCVLDPVEPKLQALTKATLTSMIAYSSEDSSDLGLDEEAGLIVCRALQNNKLDSLVVSAFGQLCQLVTSKKAIIRDTIGQVFNIVNVAEIVETARANHEAAAERARVAEEKVKELSKKVQDLVKMNVQLTQEVAILQASTAM